MHVSTVDSLNYAVSLIRNNKLSIPLRGFEKQMVSYWQSEIVHVTLISVLILKPCLGRDVTNRQCK